MHIHRGQQGRDVERRHRQGQRQGRALGRRPGGRQIEAGRQRGLAGPAIEGARHPPAVVARLQLEVEAFQLLEAAVGDGQGGAPAGAGRRARYLGVEIDEPAQPQRRRQQGPGQAPDIEASDGHLPLQPLARAQRDGDPLRARRQRQILDRELRREGDARRTHQLPARLGVGQAQVLQPQAGEAARPLSLGLQGQGRIGHRHGGVKVAGGLAGQRQAHVAQPALAEAKLGESSPSFQPWRLDRPAHLPGQGPPAREHRQRPLPLQRLPGGGQIAGHQLALQREGAGGGVAVPAQRQPRQLGQQIDQLVAALLGAGVHPHRPGSRRAQAARGHLQLHLAAQGAEIVPAPVRLEGQVQIGAGPIPQERCQVDGLARHPQPPQPVVVGVPRGLGADAPGPRSHQEIGGHGGPRAAHVPAHRDRRARPGRPRRQRLHQRRLDVDAIDVQIDGLAIVGLQQRQ